MPVPHESSRKLYEVLGSGAADSMVDWMNRTEDNTSELRRELAEFRQTVRADFAELRQEMNSKFAELRQEMNSRFARLEEQMNSRFASIDATAAQRHADLLQRQADLLKWMLGFWTASLVTIVAGVVGLAITLR